jgi:hypothetical protein
MTVTATGATRELASSLIDREPDVRDLLLGV